MGPCATCELNSSRSHPRVVSARLKSLGFCLWQSKTTVAAQVLNGQHLRATPREASILINEWVSNGTIAPYEDEASTTPVHLSPERTVTGKEQSCSFFSGAKLFRMFSLLSRQIYIDRHTCNNIIFLMFFSSLCRLLCLSL